jgi:hypothetical protein
MANQFFPFDSGPGSSVQESQWVLMARAWRESGILLSGNVLDTAGEFAVVPNTGMSLTVKAKGEAWIRGVYFRMDTDQTVTLSPADPALPRIDLVVLRADWVANTVSVAVVQGTPNANPTPPNPTQVEGSRWDIPLARVRVNAGVSSITSADITDVRPISSFAGMVPACNLTSAQNKTVGPGATVTLTWDTEKFDPTGMHDLSTQTDRLTIKEPGIYLVYAMVFWKQMSGQNINGTFNFSIYRNRNGSIDQIARDTVYIGASQGVQSCMKLIDCDTGDYLYVQVTNNSTATVDVDASQPYSPYFGAIKLGTLTGFPVW